MQRHRDDAAGKIDGRYDRLALVYREAVTLRAILIWLRASGDTP